VGKGNFLSDFVNVITPCTRRENLRLIHASIRATEWPFHWWVVLDEEEGEPLPFSDTTTIYCKTSGAGVSGNQQRNAALDRTNDGYVYFLDDDNIVHPGLFSRVVPLAQRFDTGIMVNQIMRDGRLRLTPGTIAECCCDTAQFLVPRTLIGDTRWSIYHYTADGMFFSELKKNAEMPFIEVYENLSYYNFLREDA
jgi:glycosyltransferase involved in cell wall biosynthesis